MLYKLFAWGPQSLLFYGGNRRESHAAPGNKLFPDNRATYGDRRRIENNVWLPWTDSSLRLHSNLAASQNMKTLDGYHLPDAPKFSNVKMGRNVRLEVDIISSNKFRVRFCQPDFVWRNKSAAESTNFYSVDLF